MKHLSARPPGLQEHASRAAGHAASAGASAAVVSARGRRCATAVLLASAATWLAACSGSLLPKVAQPPTRFTLDSAAPLNPATPAPGQGPVNPTPTTPGQRTALVARPALTVEEPRAAPGHDSRRMLYTRQSQQLEAFAFHEWVATPAQMLTPLLVRALQGQAALGVVLASPASAPGAWRLQTDGLRLQQDFTQSPSQVHLRLRAVLLNGSTRQAVAWREFEARVAAQQDGPEAGAAAAQAAALQLAGAVAAFCAEQMAAAAP